MGKLNVFQVDRLRQKNITSRVPEAHHSFLLIGLLAVIFGLIMTAYSFALTYNNTVVHDYRSHQIFWEKILIGNDPWNEYGQVYGPAFVVLSLFYAIHPMLPKLLYVSVWAGLIFWLLGPYKNILNSSWDRTALKFQLALMIFFNPYYWLNIPLRGHFDILVAVLCVIAVRKSSQYRENFAGISLALAILLKTFPIVVFPFLAVDVQGIRWRFVWWCLGTVSLGYAVSFLLWGESVFTPIILLTSLDWIQSTQTSLFRFLRGSAFIFSNNYDFLSLPMLIIFGGALFLLHLKYRFDHLVAAPAALLITLLLFKIGYVQYHASLFALFILFYRIRYRRVLRNTALVISFICYMIWIIYFDIMVEKTSGFKAYGGELLEIAGLITFSIGLVLWLSLIRFGIVNSARPNYSAS